MDKWTTSSHNVCSFSGICSLPLSRLPAFKASSTKGDAADLLLYDDAKDGLRVTVTAEPNRHLHVVNRQRAVALMMFRGMVRELLDEDSSAISRTKLRRLKNSASILQEQTGS